MPGTQQLRVDRYAPLTFDDLIDLHFLLEADELFLTLLRDSVFAPQTARGHDAPVQR